MSLMSEEFANTINVSWGHTTTTVKGINGVVSGAKGITEPVEIEVEGKCVKLPLLIFDQREHKLLLGLNWFNQAGAMLYPSERRIIYPELQETESVLATVAEDTEGLEMETDWFGSGKTNIEIGNKELPNDVKADIKRKLRPMVKKCVVTELGGLRAV